MAEKRGTLSEEEMENLRSKVSAIVERLSKVFPEAGTALRFNNPLELLVATVLSAQCTDERVNQVTRSLFETYRSASDYALEDRSVLEERIRPTGYYRQKAKAIQEICRALEERFGGEVPADLESLTSLPGVGRKTANLVLSEAFGIPGIIVDTHVRRVTGRIGLTHQKDPVRIEMELMEYVPKENWSRLSNLLIWHGRRTCTARNPRCPQCPLLDLCDYSEKNRG